MQSSEHARFASPSPSVRSNWGQVPGKSFLTGETPFFRDTSPSGKTNFRLAKLQINDSACSSQNQLRSSAPTAEGAPEQQGAEGESAEYWPGAEGPGRGCEKALRGTGAPRQTDRGSRGAASAPTRKLWERDRTAFYLSRWVPVSSIFRA